MILLRVVVAPKELERRWAGGGRPAEFARGPPVVPARGVRLGSGAPPCSYRSRRWWGGWGWGWGWGAAGGGGGQRLLEDRPAAHDGGRSRGAGRCAAGAAAARRRRGGPVAVAVGVSGSGNSPAAVVGGGRGEAGDAGYGELMGELRDLAESAARGGARGRR